MTEQTTRYRVEERAAQPYAYVQDANVHAGNFAVIADRFGEVFGWLAERGVEPIGPVFFKYDVINMPGPMHIQAGVPTAEQATGAAWEEPAPAGTT